ncbi:thioredoxin TrxA [Catenovulum sp. SM1970]|uniref:thioredoxin TrxA n=1 Tax=Marinifaba aquimaris TaxID=2741323 RepID=UPI00157231F5|nr:thioredoxin TrxA [Marinifaba aquimaris]NTS76542.1 thioredoxin TrxA [Marinifaba aquimaris]
MSDATIELTNDNFDAEVINSDLPVLVDFWAEWCGPCKMIAPVIDEVATELAGKVKIGKLNVDDSNEVAAKFNIRGIPTLLMFKNGAVVDNKVGAVSKGQLVEFINSHI